MDCLTPEQRKKNMKSIRSKDTSIELKLRKALWRKGIRYRKNYKLLPGKPDIAITKYKIAIFCDSEFFHGKDWEIKKTRLGSSKNAEYWITKIEKNMLRDFNNTKQLEYLGWIVIRFWGDEINKHLDECVHAIEEVIFEKKLELTDLVFSGDMNEADT